MRLLLDENLNWRLERDLPGHDVRSVHSLGWVGTHNGALLRKATQNRFDALITMDSSMNYQQNISTHKIAVVILRARSNRIADVRPLMSKVLGILATLSPGTFVIVE